MSITKDTNSNSIAVKNKHFIPSGSNLLNSGTRTLFPYLGSVAYDTTTSTTCFGNGSIWSSLGSGSGAIQGFANILSGNHNIPSGGFPFSAFTALTNADNFTVGIDGTAAPVVISQTGYYHVTAQATIDVTGVTAFPRTFSITATGQATNFVQTETVLSVNQSPLILKLVYDAHYTASSTIQIRILSNYVSPADGTAILDQNSIEVGVTAGTWYSIVKIA
jgi:hypothetical protein